jgi:hypothetical protein
VLFITSDEITAPFAPSTDPHDVHSQQEFAIYNKVVQAVIHGTPQHAPVRMTPSSVCQPNNVHAVRTQRYKLARTFDPAGVASQQWELYDLQQDANEVQNLANLNTTPPVPNATLPSWTTPAEVTAVLADLTALLSELEQRML